MADGYKLQMEVRLHNAKLVTTLLNALVILAWVLPKQVIIWLGNRVLRWYWCECRIGRGSWQRVEHRLTMEALLGG